MKYTKILLVAIASSFIFLSACTKDVSSVAIEAANEQEANERAQYWSHYALNRAGPERNFGYLTRGHTTPGKENPVVKSLLNREIYKSRNAITWDEAHDFVQAAMQHYGVDPTVYDSAYSPSLTVVAMKIAYERAMEAPQTPRRDSVMEYWMDALVLHEGAETKIMAELAQALRPAISQVKYDRYRKYIVDRAKKDIVELTPTLEEARDRIESGQEDLSEDYVFHFHLQSYSQRYVNAEDAIAMLSTSK